MKKYLIGASALLFIASCSAAETPDAETITVEVPVTASAAESKETSEPSTEELVNNFNTTWAEQWNEINNDTRMKMCSIYFDTPEYSIERYLNGFMHGKDSNSEEERELFYALTDQNLYNSCSQL